MDTAKAKNITAIRELVSSVSSIIECVAYTNVLDDTAMLYLKEAKKYAQQAIEKLNKVET